MAWTMEGADDAAGPWEVIDHRPARPRRPRVLPPAWAERPALACGAAGPRRAATRATLCST